MSGLLEQIAHTIQARNLFRRGQRILVAVSGGLDSMVLLHLLHELSPGNGWKLTVAHLNHLISRRLLDADERLVRGAAEKSGLPLVVESANVRKFARTHKLSMEMAARKVRHDFLARVARERKIPSIALAHHADDQLELFFLRLLRGSSGEGLSGMKWRNPSPSRRDIELVRPLLDQPKSALRVFATERKIKFREDASNALVDIQRNRVRHELLPLLRRDYQPALAKTVLRFIDIAGAESEFAMQAAKDWLQRASRKSPIKDAEAFERLPVAVQRRCLQAQLLDAGVVPDFELIEQLRTAPSQPINLARGKGGPAAISRSAVRDAGGLIHVSQVSQAANLAFEPGSRQLRLARGQGQASFDGLKIQWKIVRGTTVAPLTSAPGREVFDAHKVGSALILRHWRPGDRFQPAGMGRAVKLQDLFVNQKVPPGRRRKLAVATTLSGELFWVEGLRISERFKLTAATIRRLQWRWQRD